MTVAEALSIGHELRHHGSALRSDWPTEEARRKDLVSHIRTSEMLQRMQAYLNLSGDSGIRSYEIGPSFIRVQFHRGDPYLYTYQSAGRDNVEHMKQLAASGKGLSTFISQHPAVRNGYVR
ncbi:MAG TPA: hypothetical protein VN380_09170 [Thermoanaerobaculia bacterium]|jgi:hypothetical protein|nr:hypothetical protein [Thermoanaerobaculia bacterium]